MVQSGTILMSMVGVPEEQFLGLSPTRDILTSMGNYSTSHKLFPEAKLLAGPSINLAHNPEFKAMLEETLKAFLTLNIQVMCRQVEGLNFSNLVVGKHGQHCTNYNVIGRCNNCCCKYKHLPAQPSQEKVSKIMAHLKKITELIKANGLQAQN